MLGKLRATRNGSFEIVTDDDVKRDLTNYCCVNLNIPPFPRAFGQLGFLAAESRSCERSRSWRAASSFAVAKSRNQVLCDSQVL